MLKKRLIASLLVRGGIVVQSRGFGGYLPVGRPEIQAEFLNEWGVDEILLMHIDSPQQIDLDQVARVARATLVPLTVGGGVRDMEQVDALFHSGADKVFFNSALFERPELIVRVAQKYGAQSVVVGIDTGLDGRVWDPRKRAYSDVSVFCQLELAQASGAGEILLQSVERDGSCRGYDLEWLRQTSGRLRVPLIALGGAGRARHLQELFEQTNASAAAVGNLLHFSEHSVVTLKQQLRRAEQSVRLETHASYEQACFDEHGRLSKKDDQALADLLFVHVDPEVI